MKGAVIILGGLAAGLLGFDVFNAVFGETFTWTTVHQLALALGIEGLPRFVHGAFAAPGFLLFLVPAVAFYLLIMWTDYT